MEIKQEDQYLRCRYIADLIEFSPWSLGNYDMRVSYVSGIIDIVDKKTITNKVTDKQRKYSCEYYVVNNGKRVKTCKTCLLKILGETERFFRTVVNKKIECPEAMKDHRGTHFSHRKISQAKENEVKNHINRFPAYESHYTRRRTAQKYLQSDLNLITMYNLYTCSHSEPVSLSKYRDIFQSMGIKFKQPKTDLCSVCETLKLQIDLAETEKEELLNKQREHHEIADMAYAQKENDKSTCNNDTTKKIFTFDLQQVLPTPYLKTNVSYYKRQLNTYNLTVHECNTNVPYCYMWSEVDGKRGGNEIASCIFTHLKSITSNTKHIIFYSDSCVGQNKNSYVCSMFMFFLQSSDTIETIDHKFLAVGHTHMECDIDHATIERAKKKSTLKIHHPRDWYQFVRSFRPKTSFKVIEMGLENFYNFSEVAKKCFSWRKCDTGGNKFTWNSVKWLRITKEFGAIYYKTTLDPEQPFKCLKISKRGFNSISYDNLHKCYTEQLKITQEKKKDLLDLLPNIDAIYHDFYRNIKTTSNLDEEDSED